jgi:ABC-type multidrug transport system fused ATPase/permease subunit
VRKPGNSRTQPASSGAGGTDGSAAAAAKGGDAPPYRLNQIEIHRSDAIDQIKFEYSDATQWYSGHDGGKADPRVAIMTAGEFLVSVSHERFVNLRAAGAAVSFTTNKGRTFGYFPARMATKEAAETTTMAAKPGNEIIRLDIKRGVLEGIVEQPVPAAERGEVHPEQWYTLVQHDPKKHDAKTGNRYTHFHDWAEAIAAWRKLPVAAAGTAALLVDTISTRVLRKAGSDDEAVQLAIRGTTADGFAAPKEEENVSLYDAVTTLFSVLGESNDVINFGVVTILLTICAVLELQSMQLAGKVLTMIDADNATALYTDDMYASYACANHLDCTTVPAAQTAMIATFVLVKAVARLADAVNVWIHHNACDSKNKRLSQLVFAHVLSLDQAYFDVHSIAEIKGGMNVHALNDLISWNVPYIITKSMKLCLVIYFMVSINTKLAVICLASMCLIKYGVLDLVGSYERTTHKIRRKLDRMSDQIKDDAFDMTASIKMFSTEHRHVAEYTDAQQRILDSLNFLVVLRCLREFGYSQLRILTFGAVLYFGLQTVIESGMSSADLVSFFMIFGQFQDLFHGFKWHYERLVADLPDIDRYLTLMKAKPEVLDGPEELPDKLEGDIEFKNVWFEYPTRPGEPALKGLNLKIRKNAMTAIVGESGAGKSTISRLLMRLYDPTKGSVNIDGQNLRSVKVQALHDHMGIVSQTPDLFGASVGENIAYGAINRDSYSAEAFQQRIVAAAKLGNCHGFISKLRGGYDTFVGSRGAQLSGGQKQRIAIARAAIRDPKVLILDEATSALDAESEQIVQEALENIMHNRTTVVIAHRLSTIRNADDIVCMADGKVAEQGTHDELMALKGPYYNLINKQVVEQTA